ncbi:hypothetical protein L195_g022363 [Trifolium pratense]|uniref:Uncharacterized protein n=1 Tax=Trifolium pratense TaxID=57577 RepID=A0A2K3N7S2_TRIPR|nr:hypothetical protein L195_g022363 [Trifolium pratense]
MWTTMSSSRRMMFSATMKTWRRITVTVITSTTARRTTLPTLEFRFSSDLEIHFFCTLISMQVCRCPHEVEEKSNLRDMH